MNKEDLQELKPCLKCKITKTIEDFSKRSRNKDGLETICKPCKSDYNKLIYRKAPKRLDYLSKYGITSQEYNQLFEEQEGYCLGCKKHQSEFDYSLCVDHCHTTGKIRGLLCRPCNSALGFAKDNSTTLRNLVKYLENR